MKTRLTVGTDAFETPRGRRAASIRPLDDDREGL